MIQNISIGIKKFERHNNGNSNPNSTQLDFKSKVTIGTNFQLIIVNLLIKNLKNKIKTTK